MTDLTLRDFFNVTVMTGPTSKVEIEQIGIPQAYRPIWVPLYPNYLTAHGAQLQDIAADLATLVSNLTTALLPEGFTSHQVAECIGHFQAIQQLCVDHPWAVVHLGEDDTIGNDV